MEGIDIVRKLSDLKAFIEEVRRFKAKDGVLPEKIKGSDLIQLIGAKFGTSEFIRNSVMEELGTFKFIFPDSRIGDVFCFKKPVEILSEEDIEKHM